MNNLITYLQLSTLNLFKGRIASNIGLSGLTTNFPLRGQGVNKCNDKLIP